MLDGVKMVPSFETLLRNCQHSHQGNDENVPKNDWHFDELASSKCGVCILFGETSRSLDDIRVHEDRSAFTTGCNHVNVVLGNDFNIEFAEAIQGVFCFGTSCSLDEAVVLIL